MSSDSAGSNRLEPLIGDLSEKLAIKKEVNRVEEFEEREKELAPSD